MSTCGMQALWNTSLVTGDLLSTAAEAFMATTIGHMGPHNVPMYLKGITQATIDDCRYNGMQSVNAYRRYLSMPPMTSFDDFHLDANTTRQLHDLYGGDIEKVGVGLLERPDTCVTSNGWLLLLVPATDHVTSDSG